MGSRGVTCHPTQENVPRLTAARLPVFDLATPEGLKAELTWLYTKMVYLSAITHIHVGNNHLIMYDNDDSYMPSDKR